MWTETTGRARSIERLNFRLDYEIRLTNLSGASNVVKFSLRAALWKICRNLNEQSVAECNPKSSLWKSCELYVERASSIYAFSLATASHLGRIPASRF